MREPLVLAPLRFAHGGTIHEHAADFDVEVIRIEGEGFTSVDGVPSTSMSVRRSAGHAA